MQNLCDSDNVTHASDNVTYASSSTEYDSSFFESESQTPTKECQIFIPFVDEISESPPIKSDCNSLVSVRVKTLKVRFLL